MSKDKIAITQKNEDVYKAFREILALMIEHNTDNMELTFEVNKHKVKFDICLIDVKKIKPVKE